MLGHIKNLIKRNTNVALLVERYPFLKYPRFLSLGYPLEQTTPTKIIAGKNNRFKFDKSVLFNNCLFDVAGNDNEIEILPSSILNNVTFYIRGNHNKVVISKNVRFNRGGLIWIEDHRCVTTIGQNSTFEDAHLAATEPESTIQIGEDCMFAYDIDLRTGDSHSIIDCQTNRRINYAQDIKIGNHVWIAPHVSILKGASIADNCVIATRAVVTKAFVEENILIGGIPAKVIKSGINWDRRRIYDKE